MKKQQYNHKFSCSIIIGHYNTSMLLKSNYTDHTVSENIMIKQTWNYTNNPVNEDTVTFMYIEQQ